MQPAAFLTGAGVWGGPAGRQLGLVLPPMDTLTENELRHIAPNSTNWDMDFGKLRLLPTDSLAHFKRWYDATETVKGWPRPVDGREAKGYFAAQGLLRREGLHRCRTPVSPFITGSRAYGTPTKHSDVDLVIPPVSQATEARLQVINESKLPGVYMFGQLNLIIAESRSHFEAWLQGTRSLKAQVEEQGHAVTRLEACEYFFELGITGQSGSESGNEPRRRADGQSHHRHHGNAWVSQPDDDIPF